MKKIVLQIFLFSGLLFLLQNCELNKDKEAPALPPESSMIANLSPFDSLPTQKSFAIDTISFANFSAAYFNVLFWNTAIRITLAIPVFAFYESFNHQPEYNKELELWQWKYSIKKTEFVLTKLKYDTVIYTADLRGKIIDDSVDWKIYITKTNGNKPYSDFLWYYGKASIKNKGGWWILNESPYNNNKFLLINWKRENDSIGMIKYTNIKPNSSHGYLEYGTQIPDENGMNAYYNIMDTVNNKTIEIRVNLKTKAGRIKKVNESKWSCWDSKLHDIKCD